VKDYEARKSIDDLRSAINGLSQEIADVVIAHFEPRFVSANETLEAMRAAADGMAGLARLVERMGDTLNEHTQDLEKLDQDVNAARVDTATLLETQAELSGRVTRVQELLAGFADVARRAAAS
jgi:phosphate uptake regulator